MESRTYHGVVQKGQRRGVALGFPTANIPLPDDSLPGIYAARVKVANDEASYMAAVYADARRKLLEAHLLDFNDELYGMDIEITLLEKIRDDMKFTDDAVLRATIQSDTARVRAYFSQK